MKPQAHSYLWKPLPFMHSLKVTHVFRNIQDLPQSSVVAPRGGVQALLGGRGPGLLLPDCRMSCWLLYLSLPQFLSAHWASMAVVSQEV